MKEQLSKQRVLVIGGSKYLGLAVARRAGEAGAEVVIGARNLEQASQAAAQLPGASAIHIDITDESTIAAAAAKLGHVDHVVITASAHHNVLVKDLEHDKIVAAFEAKVIGPLLLAKHFAPILSPTGSILLFSGVAAWKPAPGYTVMGVTNGAVAFLASQLAKELAPIRVNAISPGITDSGTWDPLGEQDKKGLFAGAAASSLVGRVGTADDIADAAIWLLSAGNVSGETIHIEGGARHV
ncbi:MAG TPA: SDR family oxidoreductase [Methylomusa anaerophila]|uniref:Enoyl-[acyl-carrier-protein] reductase [NADH] FabI n=1 Tax=Methylomusa anaerophila TaxID=1930071 RepID=A0A348AN42_9FIRM|nr:SDR family oxidoreductase [Methylomusa anaerophila]BBB92490.1 enoyl-[acyl-carrier-protein] reductase [NADH] FabI [Methylomusa anaerophila]HML87658.1 SDR family oxidoreductase [Methylomusa anaerophila]